MIEAAVLDPSEGDPAEARRCEAWLAFQRRFAFEPENAIELLSAEPEPRAALARAGLLVEVEAEAAAADRVLLARLGVRLLPWTSERYPPALRVLVDAPPLLCVRGDARALGPPAVAIVGARAATVEGLETARALGSALAERGLAVVSGLARGIDAAAHRGALEAGGVTVAVQACGADRVYPTEHRALADAIAASGAVVSELPVGSPPKRAHFPLRNRLISGLSLATVVVEARLRSGSLVTAAHALGQGREVLAVPGPLSAPTSEGPNRLLRDGARPMLDVEDVLGALPESVVAGLSPGSDGGARIGVDGAARGRGGERGEPLGKARRPGRNRRGRSGGPGARGDRTRSDARGEPGGTGGLRADEAEPTRSRTLDDRDHALLESLDRCAQGRDGLVRALGWTVSEVTARLLALEVEGRVHQDRDGRFRRRRRLDLRA